ncbi:putative pfkb family carbohydrate kinase [Golovinomyces cichoracearum]|uniref:Putative pfkb family carbohydrate kinase n=1 Tax=Golovinomyces cichoracearum TaxID=62708 RepID=A0A420HHX2_9PEZI|nr:putative pfkb family carbohydrate kinase [Golovinomyces cichoracearum]
MENDSDSGISPDQEIDFCTFGMLIIDEIQYPPPRLPVSNILGGAGTYAAVGARLFSPPPLSKRICWVVDAGSDFPSKLTSLIQSWETSVLLRKNPSRLTTRGINTYDANEKRDFKYSTPKLRIDVSDIESHPALLLSKSFHIICSPSRCISTVTNLLQARKRLCPLTPKPIIVWEPVPDSCISSELLNLTNCLPYIDVCSPNHTELLNFFSESSTDHSDADPSNESPDTNAIEEACEQLLAAMPLQTYALVIRCGENGVYLAKNGGRSRRPSISGRVRKKRPANHARGGLTPDVDMAELFAGFDADADRGPISIDPGTSLWLPAYFENQKKGISRETSGVKSALVSRSNSTTNKNSVLAETSISIQDSSRVVDPTGAGNSFLGALTVALAREKVLEEAVCWGSVAASFIVEQIGTPLCTKLDKVQGLTSNYGSNHANPTGSVVEAEEETWNNESVPERLEKYLRRVQRCKISE